MLDLDGSVGGKEEKQTRVGKQSEKEGVATTIAMRVGNLVSFLQAAGFRRFPQPADPHNITLYKRRSFNNPLENYEARNY